MTADLRRKGHHVAACTIDRLMRDEGLNWVVRGRQHRTTIDRNHGRTREDFAEEIVRKLR